MKKLIFILCLFFSTSLFAQQDLTKNCKIVKDTIVNKVNYKLYEGLKGGRFIIVTSKTGKEYKRYFKK